jgi:hypothetical protein
MMTAKCLRIDNATTSGSALVKAELLNGGKRSEEEKSDRLEQAYQSRSDMLTNNAWG